MSDDIDKSLLRRYEISQKLGKGAYGIVWKAIDKKTKEQLATAKLFHWNGPNKPWGGKKKRRPHPELFEPYMGKGEACDPG